MTQQIIKPPAGAIARPQQAAPSRLQGEEADDIILPRIHVFQGLPKEREIYGARSDGTDWKEGEFINTLTKDLIPARRFVPIFGYAEFIRFKEPRGSGLEYRTRDKAEVPAGDLEWDRVNSKPPLATRFLNWVCLFESMNDPLVLSFKGTSINTGKAINTMERFRGSRGPGLYEVSLRKKQNSKGAWLSPEVRAVGEPAEEMKSLAQMLFDSLSGANVTVDVQGAEQQFNPDDE